MPGVAVPTVVRQRVPRVTDERTTLETREVEQVWRIYTDRGGREVRVSQTQTYDHAAQILRLTGHRRWREGDEERTQVTHEALRYTFPQELIALLHHHSFTLIRQCGDWSLESLNATSLSIIVLCRK